MAWFVINFVEPKQSWQTNSIVSPVLSRFSAEKPNPTATPRPSPKVFQLNESTNLNQELELVNPEVKEDDFSELKTLTERL